MTRSPILFAAAALLLAAAPPLAAESDAVDRGIEQLEAGDLAAARATLEAALDEGAERHRALAHLGRLELADGQLDRAIDRLREAVELRPDESMYRTWLGRAYIAKLQTVSFFERGMLAGRALDALEKAVELDPANVEARVTLAGYYLNAPSIAGGSKRKAGEQAAAILPLDPARGHLILARIHVVKEEYDEAFARLAQCVEARPSELDCRYQQAMLHQELEQWDESFEAFERILEIEPESRGALYQLARTAVFSGARLERGVECLEKYLALEARAGYPGHDAAHWRLGMLFERRGEPKRARAEYEAALALKPEEKRYREALEALGES